MVEIRKNEAEDLDGKVRQSFQYRMLIEDPSNKI